MRSIERLLVLAATFVIATAASAARAADKAEPVEVLVTNDNSRGLHYFEPAGLRVEPGQTVRWVSSSYHHSVTAYHPANGRELRIPEGAQPFDAILGEAGRDHRGSFELTLTEPGTYDYYCRFHEANGEVGRIVVGARGGPAEKPPGYGGAPPLKPGSVGLASALPLERVRQVFAHLDPQRIIDEGTVPFPAEELRAGFAWHPANPVAIADSGNDASRDPFAGRWTLDPGRSRFPGKPPLREEFTYEIASDGAVRFLVEEVREGGRINAEYRGRFDGKDYPITGAPGRDTLAMARVDAATILGVYKDKGRVTYAFVRTLSDDGRIMTSRVLGSGPEGRPVDVLLVHERASGPQRQ